jgi:Beta-galactosidase/beta-glucuronidase
MLLGIITSAFSYAPRVSAADSAAASATPEYHGLKADYYTVGGPPNYTFGTFKGTGMDEDLDISSLESAFSLFTGVSDRVGVRWTGFIQPEFSEDYTFYITGDNGFRLWINDQLTIDHWVGDWDKEQTSQPVALEAGKKYSIKLELFEDNGGSNVHLSWSSPSVEKGAIPAEAFSLPDGYQPAGYVLEDGLHAELRFDEPLTMLEEGNLAAHLTFKIASGTIPIASAALKEGDARVVDVQFENPVASMDISVVKAIYDGLGGLATAGGTVIAAFDKAVVNGSKYQIMTPWADDVESDNVLPEYPRPQLARDEWLNLNGEWQFQAAKKNDSLPTGQQLKEKILVPFAAEAKLSGINRVEDLMWYKRDFNLPDSWDGRHVKLNFGAVDYEATVYVNGHEVGSHKGGYNAFSFDITEYLVPGDNELIVHVLDETDNGADQAVGKQTVKKLGGIWYTSVSGIWQTVWLEPVNEAHIEKLDMTTDIHNNELQLNVAGSGINGETVEAVVSSDGQVVGTAAGTVGSEIIVPVPNARLWSPDDPFLYDLKVYLKDGPDKVDEVSSYFGMREIKLGKVDGVTRPLLNDNFVFQMGTLDQGFWPDGIYTAPTDEALKSDIEAVKRVGMNTIRKHIKVEPARWYYWADKLGVLVWQDMPSLEDRQGNKGSDITQATKDEWLKEYKEMVDQLRSVTSIIVWTVFNEGWGQFDAGGQQTKDATNYVKSLDATRLINNASGWWDSGAGDLIDMHSYPSPGSPAPTDTRAAVLGEYGGLGLHVPGHEWSPLVFSYQLMSSKEQLTNNYISYISKLKELKLGGLSAAIYTQLTDVEYEINGLLTYDRKVEKLDFNRVAAAHRELIGTTSNEDLLGEIAKSENLINGTVVGDGAGQYKSDVAEAFQTAIDEAKAIAENTNTTSAVLTTTLLGLQSARSTFFSSVNDPIPAGSTVDAFDGPELNSAWTVFKPDNSKWSLTSKPGFLSLETSKGDTYETGNSLPNIFLQDAPAGDFVITTKVNAAVRKNYQQAGVFLWQDEDHYLRLGHVWDTTGSTGKSLETAYEYNASYVKAKNMATHPGYDTSYLQIRKVGNVVSTYYWDGTAWKPAADPVTVNLTNLKVGLYGASTGDGISVQADFDYFSVGAVSSIDKSALQAAITAADEELAGAQAGTAPGQYPQAAIDSFAEAITSAKAVEENDAAEQAEIDAAVEALQAASAAFADAMISDQPTATLAGAATVKAGQSFELTVGTANVTEEKFDSLYAVMLTVNFDPSEVSLDDAISLNDSFGVLEKQVIEPGKVRIIAAGQGSGINANSQWLKLSFTAAVTGNLTNAQISISGVEAANAEGEEIQLLEAAHTVVIRSQADYSELELAIEAAEAVYDSAVTGTLPGQYPAAAKAKLGAAIEHAKLLAAGSDLGQEEINAAITELNAAVTAFKASVLKGDINNDSKISIGDLGILAAAYGKSSEDSDWAKYKQSDLNGDGIIDIEDIAMLARWILG